MVVLIQYTAGANGIQYSLQTVAELDCSVDTVFNIRHKLLILLEKLIYEQDEVMDRILVLGCFVTRSSDCPAPICVAPPKNSYICVWARIQSSIFIEAHASTYA